MKSRRVGLNPRSICLAILPAILFCAAISAQTALPDSLVGKDLWKHPPTRAQLAQLQRLLEPIPKGFMMEPAPWHIWKLGHESEMRYVVLLGEGPMSIPGGTSVCIQLFDAASTRIESWSFQTGWRNFLIDASIESPVQLDTRVLVLRASPVINGRDIAKEYYSLGDDRLRLVRLEDSKGAAVQNEYVFRDYEIGLIPSGHSVEDWARLLQSKDKADVLSALVFLGGRHLDEKERMILPGAHESSYAALFEQLINAPSIHDLIVELTNSGTPWIREAAILAARDPRQRRLQ
jgi:hypothetical protein